MSRNPSQKNRMGNYGNFMMNELPVSKDIATACIIAAAEYLCSGISTRCAALVSGPLETHSTQLPVR